MKEDKNIEDLFRSSFEDFEVAPPVQVKGRIDRELDSVLRRRIWWIAGLTLLVGAVFSAWLFLQPGEESFENTTVSAETNPVQQNNSVYPTENEFVVASESKGRGSNSIQDRSTVHKNAGDAHTENPEKAKPERRNSFVSPDKKKPGKNLQKGTRITQKKKSARRSGNGTGGVFWGDDGVLLSDLGTQQSFGGETTGDTENPSAKTEPKQNESGKKDSIAGKEQPAKADSLTVPKDETAPKEKLKKPQSGLWTASFYASPMFGSGLQSPKPLEELNEKTGFRFSAEVNRALFGGYGISTGVGYRSQSETYSQSYMSYDSLFVGYDSIPIYSGDTIIGYDTIAVYNVDSTKTTYSQGNIIRTVFIPVYFSRQFSFDDHWGMLVNAGMAFRFHTFKTGAVDSILPVVSVNKFSMSVLGRIHATYSMNRLVFSAGVSGGFDLKSPLTYGTTERKRYTLTPEIGIHFTF